MHASMYTPLSIPPTQLPQYVHFDRMSQWHTSALLSAALESITLPTRLKHGTQKRWLIDDLEAALNVNGKQRIAQLQCSMLDSGDAPLVTTITHGSIDDRIPSGNHRVLVEEDKVELDESKYDMDLSCRNTRLRSRSGTQHDMPDHVFGAIETTRTKTEAAKYEGRDEDEINYGRKRRRLAGLPGIERFVTPTLSRILPLRRIFLTRYIPCRYRSSLEYPLVDSFPPIFAFSPGRTQVAVQTSLSTTTGISNRIKALKCVISKMAKLDERETLSDGLGVISEAYEDGWHSGSDESDD